MYSKYIFWCNRTTSDLYGKMLWNALVFSNTKCLQIVIILNPAWTVYSNIKITSIRYILIDILPPPRALNWTMLLLARLLLHSFSCRLVSFESSLKDLVFNDQRKIKSKIFFSIILFEELDNIYVKRSVWLL